MTSYLAAAQMLAAWREMPSMERGHALAVGLPVNLRNYFPSDTARNFFNTVRVAHIFTGEETLDELAREFDAKLRDALSEDRIKAQMDGFERFERIPGVRPVPLFFKNWVVGLCNWVEARKVTLTISNMGRVSVPEAVRPYIQGFAAYCSTPSLFTTVCSYGDDLVLGTTSAYRSTNVLKTSTAVWPIPDCPSPCMRARCKVYENLPTLPYPGGQRFLLPPLPKPFVRP